jgi:hypothetical protein
MAYIRQEIRGTSGQDIAKMNENFMGIYEKVFGDINFSDTDTALQNSILTQYIPFQGEGNLDSKYPLTIRFYVPPNVKKIKNATVNVFLENYRMDSDITEGGGGVAGGEVSLSVASGGGYTNTLSQGAETSYVRKWGSPGYEVQAPTDYIYPNNMNMVNANLGGFITSNDNRTTYGSVVPSGKMNNSSVYTNYVDLHSIQHSHEIPSHSHSISIEPHTHSGSASVTIPNHHHSLKEGIRVSTTAPGTTTIAVNDTNVCSVSASKVSENDVDITSYIKVGEWNIIKVSTTNLARISVYGTIEAIMRLT